MNDEQERRYREWQGKAHVALAREAAAEVGPLQHPNQNERSNAQTNANVSAIRKWLGALALGGLALAGGVLGQERYLPTCKQSADHYMTLAMASEGLRYDTDDDRVRQKCVDEGWGLRLRIQLMRARSYKQALKVFECVNAGGSVRESCPDFDDSLWP